MPSTKKIILAAVVAAIGLAGFTAINVRNERAEQENNARLLEISQRMQAETAITMRLNEAENQFMNGNYADALPVFRELTEEGNAYALHNLGWAYKEGLGVEQDHAQALEWFKKAVAAEDGPISYSAAYYVGESYHKGLGVSADRDEAILWLRIAQDNGIKEATAYLQELGAE